MNLIKYQKAIDNIKIKLFNGLQPTTFTLHITLMCPTLKENLHYLTYPKYKNHFTACHQLLKVKDSCNRPGVVQRVPRGLGSQIS
jgi:hypothetical protein